MEFDQLNFGNLGFASVESVELKAQPVEARQFGLLLILNWLNPKFNLLRIEV